MIDLGMSKGVVAQMIEKFTRGRCRYESDELIDALIQPLVNAKGSVSFLFLLSLDLVVH